MQIFVFEELGVAGFGKKNIKITCCRNSST